MSDRSKNMTYSPSELENENTDREFDTPVMVRGQMYRTSGGWYYWDGTMTQPDAGLLRVSALGVNIADISNSDAGDFRVSAIGTITADTELPAAASLADATANPSAPAVAAHLMGYNGSTWDRALAYNLVDGDTGSGTYLIPGVNIVSRGSGGPVEAGTSTNAFYTQLRNTASYSDGATGSDFGPVYNFPWLLNQTGGSNTWNRWEAAILPSARTGGAANTGFANPHTTAAKVGNVMQRDDTATDLVAEGNWHYPRITSDRNQLVAIKAQDSASIDAFGRWRVSEPTTIFDSKLLYDAAPLIWDDVQTSGTATTSHSVNTASVTLGVNATTAGVRTRQTFMRFNYQPGKSQMVLMTFVLDKSGGGTGITRRVGMFDASNGIFLEDAEGTYNLVQRTYTGGSASDTAKVAKASWNIDPMDGSGPSGVTLNFANTQIMLIDFEWLGVGRVRVGFVVDGKIYYAHQFLNTNSLTTVYMSTPNLPLRYEITNSGTGAASTLECICASVISEGGIQKNGILRGADTGAIVTNLDSGGTYALLGIQLKSTTLSASVDLESISLTIASAAPAKYGFWRLYWNPTVAGTFAYNAETNSVVNIARNGAGSGGDGIAQTITNGYIIASGTVETNGSVSVPLTNALRLGSTISGTADCIVLAYTSTANDTTVMASLNWRELT